MISIEKQTLKKIKPSLYSRYYAEVCNEWWSPSLRRCNTISNPPPKKRRNGGEPLTSIAMSLTSTLSGRYKASLNLNFHMFCAIIKATKKVRFIVYKYHITIKLLQKIDSAINLQFDG